MVIRTLMIEIEGAASMADTKIIGHHNGEPQYSMPHISEDYKYFTVFIQSDGRIIPVISKDKAEWSIPLYIKSGVHTIDPNEFAKKAIWIDFNG